VLIILIGLPGSGKGTQGQFLANKLHLPHLSTGNMFRKMAKSEGLEGDLLRQQINAGKLVSGDLVNKIVSKFLTNDDYKNGCVLDGYPRNLEQAKFLEEITKQPITVIYLSIDDDTVIKRILGRFNCAVCEKNYNLYFDKPKIENVCDNCGSSDFTHRVDDNENTIKDRIEIYKKETFPLIEYYKNKISFYSVDASRNIEEVASLLSDLLKRV
jgi:adenylate kinase